MGDVAKTATSGAAANQRGVWLDRCGHAGLRSAAHQADAACRPERVAFLHPAGAARRLLPALHPAKDAVGCLSEFDWRNGGDGRHRRGRTLRSDCIPWKSEHQRWPRPDGARLREFRRGCWISVPGVEMDGRRCLSRRVPDLHGSAAGRRSELAGDGFSAGLGGPRSLVFQHDGYSAPARRHGIRAAHHCAQGRPGVQWDPLQLGALYHEPGGFPSLSREPVAKNHPGGLRDSARDCAERIPDSGHRAALRKCRPAHDRQHFSSPGWPLLFPAVSGAADRVHGVAAAPGAMVTLFFLLPFAAGFFSLLLAVFSLLRRKRSPAAWCFSAGMAALGLDSVFTGLSLRATQLGEVAEWLAPAFIVKSLVPVVWLCFSLTYSRSNYRAFVARWKIPLAFLGLLPIGVSLGFLEQLGSPATPGDLWWLQSGAMAQALNVIFLMSLVLILTHLEQTFRSAVGTMRWRIKFVVVALAVIFGARLYVRSQAMLFSAHDIALWSIESGALLIGCFVLALAYARTGLAEIDVYPSTAVLRSSLTVLIVGGYLFIVGVLAQVVRRFGGAEIFQYQAVVVLLGMAGLAVLLLSDRARQRIHAFVVRHFRKAQHDSARIWTLFSLRLASVTDQARLCAVSAKLISETFDALSVTVWLLDEEKGRLIVGASTARQASNASGACSADTASSAVIAGLRVRSSPFDLEDIDEAWAEELRQLNSTAFPNGGNRLCVPLLAGERSLGVRVLADRVSGAVYTVEA